MVLKTAATAIVPGSCWSTRIEKQYGTLECVFVWPTSRICDGYSYFAAGAASEVHHRVCSLCVQAACTTPFTLHSCCLVQAGTLRWKKASVDCTTVTKALQVKPVSLTALLSKLSFQCINRRIAKQAHNLQKHADQEVAAPSCCTLCLLCLATITISSSDGQSTDCLCCDASSSANVFISTTCPGHAYSFRYTHTGTTSCCCCQLVGGCTDSAASNSLG